MVLVIVIVEVVVLLVVVVVVGKEAAANVAVARRPSSGITTPARLAITRRDSSIFCIFWGGGDYGQCFYLFFFPDVGGVLILSSCKRSVSMKICVVYGGKCNVPVLSSVSLSLCLSVFASVFFFFFFGA